VALQQTLAKERPSPVSHSVRIDMKKQIILIFSIFIVISCTSKGGSQEHSASCTVSNSMALFKVPIEPQKAYKYFKKATPDNVSEYDCDISLRQYRFGFSLFKFPGSKERKGTIEKVLNNGQSTIWLTEGNSFSALEGHGFTISYSAPYIVMKIANPSTIGLLFKEHPPKCSFRITGFNAPKYDGEIEIQYKEF
jgi:hypothetical protein